MTKTLNKLEVEGNLLHMIEETYKKPRANIILDSKRLNISPPRSGSRQGCPLLPLLSKIVLEILTSPITGTEEIKDKQIGKAEVTHKYGTRTKKGV